ncbi:hypothetical protein CONPUDRAFT_134168 [Coniophora puteana RWD-64-598 SS2]|uniref:Glycosyltransferase family 32 protein n=1 Tax=Coniophora puteana (strain RWD-64-598) TaxID=741705 RepID=A0A5M3N5X7_CONPW|nr:uncharacterized protein CONPUDRAFT_134168 [Coniophora puteana RWD-64-598 SS2]EIW86819.1 hypothetical protein CONPUDRAFT_134168 [Coniophora puteana RWD-64-598 SS2]
MRQSPSWLPVSVSFPPSRPRRPRLRRASSPSRLPPLHISSLRRRRSLVCRCIAFVAGLFAVLLVVALFGAEETHWAPSFRDSTLIFGRENLQRIWKWEIESGHYPSIAKIPERLGFTSTLFNPAVPPARAHTLVSPFTPPSDPAITQARGYGPQRIYRIPQADTPMDIAYPPRPLPGSTADLDIILEQCNFAPNDGKYVRDCLEFLRLGANLDNGRRVRKGIPDEWSYVFHETDTLAAPPPTPSTPTALKGSRLFPTGEPISNAGLVKKRGAAWEPLLDLSPPQVPKSLSNTCDPENPRIFHMFWAGPFTEKPYASLLSFLFTQRLDLHLNVEESTSVCRPQVWLWINPGPAASVPNPTAVDDMYASLKSNPWSTLFLHPRFNDVIKFKLWNTTEQLDAVPELRHEWRNMGSLFKSGGYVVNMPAGKVHNAHDEGDDNSMFNRAGSKSPTSYDRLSVILSDMVRFILCHRFGGIYLDADTLFLRDWEELWGWKGAFAYRWSYHDAYNTAVLRMNKNSALGSFLFRTAVKNGLDFHPMSISKYLDDAHLQSLLFRVPDALFDPAWLNTEGYQLDRPPAPFFTEFSDFFDTPAVDSAAPQVVGFDGFFRGAFSYHFHNFWSKPFDPSRNWPDLGPRFAESARAARAAARPNDDPDDWNDKVYDDKQDLDWSAVLKRTFEAYVRGERPNMYGEWLRW